MVEIADHLFIGNEFEQGTLNLGDEVKIDLRNLRSPLVIFSSYGDNITPPHQALAWLKAVCKNTEEALYRTFVPVGAGRRQSMVGSHRKTSASDAHQPLPILGEILAVDACGRRDGDAGPSTSLTRARRQSLPIGGKSFERRRGQGRRSRARGQGSRGRAGVPPTLWLSASLSAHARLSPRGVGREA